MSNSSSASRYARPGGAAALASLSKPTTATWSSGSVNSPGLWPPWKPTSDRTSQKLGSSPASSPLSFSAAFSAPASSSSLILLRFLFAPSAPAFSFFSAAAISVLSLRLDLRPLRLGARPHVRRVPNACAMQDESHVVSGRTAAGPTVGWAVMKPAKRHLLTDANAVHSKSVTGRPSAVASAEAARRIPSRRGGRRWNVRARPPGASLQTRPRAGSPSCPLHSAQCAGCWKGGTASLSRWRTPSRAVASHPHEGVAEVPGRACFRKPTVTPVHVLADGENDGGHGGRELSRCRSPVVGHGVALAQRVRHL